LSPLGTAATNRPIVPVPGDYDDEEIGGMMMTGRGNRSTRRNPAPIPLCYGRLRCDTVCLDRQGPLFHVSLPKMEAADPQNFDTCVYRVYTASKSY
jgi:hypothetical protein